MKVLWFSNSPGNSIEYLPDSFVGSSWISSLDKRIQGNVDLHLAFYYPKRSDPFKYGETTYHPIGIKNWKLIALREIFFGRIIDKEDLRRYLEIIKSVNPDLIHIHGTENPFGCIIPYTEIPVIVSIQGYLTVIDYKFQNIFTKRDLRAGRYDISSGIKEFVLRKSFLRAKKVLEKKKEIEQRNLKETRYLMGRTDWDRRVASVIAPDCKYFHCDEIIRDVFHKTKWQYSNKSKLIIHSTIGNKPYKGFDTICEALNLLKSLQSIQVEWQIAGLTQDESIVKVTKHKLKMKFPTTGIKYLGKADEHQLAAMMCNADIFVSPSHIENSSNSLCEAMLLGMPCIATYAGGTGSLIKDKEEGILIQDGDPWAMAGALLELFLNHELAIKYGEKARERALIRHNSNRIVGELLSYYGEIVTKNKYGENNTKKQDYKLS